jgi:hypothetical protein
MEFPVIWLKNKFLELANEISLFKIFFFSARFAALCTLPPRMSAPLAPPPPTTPLGERVPVSVALSGAFFVAQATTNGRSS